jgi:hypothetical protein
MACSPGVSWSSSNLVRHSVAVDALPQVLTEMETSDATEPEDREASKTASTCRTAKLRGLLALMQAALAMPIPWTRWTGPSLPISRLLALSVYCGFLAFLHSYKAIRDDASFLERLGFRAAHVSNAQVPLVILLSSRINLVEMLIATPYGKLCWWHRWVGRAFIASSTLHALFFLVEWAPMSFLGRELELVPSVAWGIASWGILLWTFLSSLWPVRFISYEFFVAQHGVSAALAVGLLWAHLPAHHRLPLTVGIGLLAWDATSRACWFLWRNVNLSRRAYGCFEPPVLGYGATIDTHRQLTNMTIHNVKFAPPPGSHLYVWILDPETWLQTFHPFSVLSGSMIEAPICSCNHVQLLVQRKGGFTKKLSSTEKDCPARMFLLGPFRSRATWKYAESLILISGSTGASYTVSILEDIVKSYSDSVQTKFAHALLMGRHESHVDIYSSRVMGLEGSIPRELSIILDVVVTGGAEWSVGYGGWELEDHEVLGDMPYGFTSVVDDADNSTIAGTEASEEASSATRSESEEAGSGIAAEIQHAGKFGSIKIRNGGTSHGRGAHQHSGRPDLRAYIEEAAASASGTVMVVVCGGSSLVSAVRCATARINLCRAWNLSQLPPLGLHVEEYSL